jgi:preprotein translocase subunit Sss1
MLDSRRDLLVMGLTFLCVGLVGFALLIRWGY